jgi:hypothetical protein
VYDFAPELPPEQLSGVEPGAWLGRQSETETERAAAARKTASSSSPVSARVPQATRHHPQGVYPIALVNRFIPTRVGDEPVCAAICCDGDEATSPHWKRAMYDGSSKKGKKAPGMFESGRRSWLRLRPRSPTLGSSP